MAQAHKGDGPKSFNLPASAMKIAREFAELHGMSVSAVGREWLESYVERGSDYVPERMEKLQIVAPRELIDAALARAKEEGVSLRDVILFEISEIQNL